MPQEKIIIKFIPDGHPQLIAAIKKLNTETKKLTGSTKGTQQTFSALNTKMLQVHSTLKAQGKGWQALGISVKTGTAALMGNKNAISMVNARLRVLGITQAQINKGALLGVRNNRLLANSFATLRSQLLLISFGAMLVERAFVSLVKAHGRQEAANEKLAVGLTNVQGTTEGVTQRLIDYSSALQKATAFGDEMITTGMVQFTTFGLNEQAIKALTPQVLNVARAIQTTSGSMPDLNSLFIAFGKATTTGIGTLTRYGVVLTEVERAQLESMDANESAVKIADILDRQYGGLASAYAKTTSGMLEAAAAARGDAAEAFGEVLAPRVLELSNAFKFMFEAMSPERIRQYGTGLLIGAGATTALALATGRLNVQLAISRTALMRSGWGVLVVVLGTAAGALLNYFGILEDTTDAQEDYEKRLKSTTEQKRIFAAQVYAAIDAINAEKDAYNILIATTKAQEDEKEKELRLYRRSEAMKRGTAETDIKLMEIKNGMLHVQRLWEAELISEIQYKIQMHELDIKNLNILNKINAVKQAMASPREALDIEFGVISEAAATRLELERQIQNERQALIDGGYMTEIEARELYIERMAQLDEQEKENLIAFHAHQIEENNQWFITAASGYDTFFNNLLNKNMTAQQKLDAIWDSMTHSLIKFLADQLKQLILNTIAQKVVAKGAESAAMASAATTGAAISAAYTPAALVANIASFGAAGVAASASFGVAAAALEASKVLEIPVAERGGLIGGGRHSQGGTMINAEQGEFVMSRSAVDSVGIENLNRMNGGGGGGGSVTVNISGNVMSQDYVEGELAEQIKEAVRRGNDFGIS